MRAVVLSFVFVHFLTVFCVAMKGGDQDDPKGASPQSSSEGLFEDDVLLLCVDGQLSLARILEAQKSNPSSPTARQLVLFAENRIKLEGLQAELALWDENLALIEGTQNLLTHLPSDSSGILAALRNAITEVDVMLGALDQSASDAQAYASDCQIMKLRIDAFQARKTLYEERLELLQRAQDKDFLRSTAIAKLEEQKTKRRIDLSAKKAVFEKMPILIDDLKQKIIAAFQGKLDITEGMLNAYFQEYRKMPKGTFSAVELAKVPQRKLSFRNLKDAFKDVVTPPASPRKRTDSPALQRRKTRSYSSLPDLFPQDYANLTKADLEAVLDGQGCLIFDRVQKRQVDARSPEKGSNASNVFTYLMLYPADQQTIDKKRVEIKTFKAEKAAATEVTEKERLQGEIEKRESHISPLRNVRREHKKRIRAAFETVGLTLEDKALRQFEKAYAAYKEANP